MPTIGRRIDARRRGQLQHLAQPQAVELRQVVGHQHALPGGRHTEHVPVAGDRAHRRQLLDAQQVEREQHHRRVPRNITRGFRMPCTRRMPGMASSSAVIVGGKPNRANRDLVRRHDEQVGIERGPHPVEDRPVAGARHPGERHDERDREHQRRHGCRRPARRLNEAVGGERALDRPQPLQHRPHQAREPKRQQRRQEQHAGDRQQIARIEDRARAPATRQPADAAAQTDGQRSRAAGSRRRTASGTCPSAAPAPARRVRRRAPESARRPGSSRSRCRSPTRAATG